MALRDPQHLRRAEGEVAVPGVQAFGMYAVLGSYDFVTLVEAENNEQVARFSIELGVKAGVHVTTMPAVPISRLEEATRLHGGEAAVDLREALPQRRLAKLDD